MKLLRIGVTGCGFMGSLHAAAIHQSARAELVAVHDTRPEAAAQVAREHAATAYASLTRMLQDANLDGLVVATPDRAHLAPVLEAAGAGVGLLVEKPLATRISDADTMIRACQASGSILMVGHVLRFETAYANLRLAVREGAMGAVSSIFARRHALASEAYRFGGDTSVVDYLGIHDFDLLNWIHPARPVRVNAVAARRAVHRSLGTPDVVMSTFTYEDGSIATVESGWTLPQAWGSIRAPAAWSPFGDVRLDVFCEEGAVSTDLRTMNLTGVDTKGWRHPDTRHWPRLHGRIAGALREEVDHFLACMGAAEEPLSSGRTARGAVVLCDAVHRSLETEAPVEIEGLEEARNA